jgi:hypothetical protein
MTAARARIRQGKRNRWKSGHPSTRRADERLVPDASSCHAPARAALRARGRLYLPCPGSAAWADVDQATG